MKKKDYEPISMLYARLGKNEKHLHSFSAQLCRWEKRKKYLFFGKVLNYFPEVPTFLNFSRGHITNQRLIFEFPDINSNRETLGAFLKIASTITGGLYSSAFGFLGDEAIKSSKDLNDKKIISIKFEEIDKVFCWKNMCAYWAVIKGSNTELGIPFIPRFIDNEGNPASGDLFRDFLSIKDLDDFSALANKFFKVEEIRAPYLLN